MATWQTVVPTRRGVKEMPSTRLRLLLTREINNKDFPSHSISRLLYMMMFGVYYINNGNDAFKQLDSTIYNSRGALSRTLDYSILIQ